MPLREAVLGSWTASPTRFREDANAESDVVVGPYRDRLVVELAQNAADAAAAVGVPGRLMLVVQDAPWPGAPEGCGPGEGGLLVVANTGAPLTRAGVQALASLRASAKRGDGPRDPGPAPGDGQEPQDGTGGAASAVGRFGVGFAAVLTVCDDVAVLSRHGTGAQGVRFGRAATAHAVRSRPDVPDDLLLELRRREGQVPVLRLPFAVQAPAEVVPEGYDTVVLVPLRDGAARRTAEQACEMLGDDLLLALPALVEVRTRTPHGPGRVLDDVTARWHVQRRTGTVPAELLAGLPVEDRAHDRWSVTWAVPRAGAAVAAWKPVLCAPTPTDDPLPWPALLVATLPLGPDRRRAVPGPVADLVLDEAADVYADLVEQGTPGPWYTAVPGGFPAGAVDARLREAVLARLRDRPVLPGPDGRTVVPRRAVALDAPWGADPGVVAALATGWEGLVHVPHQARAALRLLEVEQIGLAEAVEALPAPDGPDAWGALVRALAPLMPDATAVEALATLPVPLADGRTVRSPRGTVLLVGVDGPDEARTTAAALHRFGVRVVCPDSVLRAGPWAADLLVRLGAEPLPPERLAALPAVHERVMAWADDPDLLVDDDLGPSGSDPADAPAVGVPGASGVVPAGVAAVLDLVAAALRATGDLPEPVRWAGELPLPDAAADLVPAAHLAVPRSPAHVFFEPGEVGRPHPELLARWGADVLTAVGVVDALGVLHADEARLDEYSVADDARGLLHPASVDGFEDWAEDVALALGADRNSLVTGPVQAVADLDLVRVGATADLLRHLDADPALRAVVVRPVQVRDERPGGGAAVTVPPPTAWWLRRELADGLLWAVPGRADADLAGVLAGPPVDVDGATLQALGPDLVHALGGVQGWPDLAATPGRWTVDAVLDVLQRLADPAVAVGGTGLLRWWQVLGELDPVLVDEVVDALDDDAEDAAPDGAGPGGLVRVVHHSGRSDLPAHELVTMLVPCAHAAVVHRRRHLQLASLGHQIWAPDAVRADRLSRLLQVPRAERTAPAGPRGCAAPQPLPRPLRDVLDVAGVPAPTWCEHDDLVVGSDTVDWWTTPGLVHACTVDGLAAGLCDLVGRDDLRAPVQRVLHDPGDLLDVLAEVQLARGARGSLG